LIGTTVKLHSK